MDGKGWGLVYIAHELTCTSPTPGIDHTIMEKRNLGFWEIWNMSFGFLGIQFGWGLQMANMSPIYEYLGAKPEEIPMLWLAAPLTGLVVQPIIGAWSDRTWTSLGRRKPFFLVGAILSSIALVFMPNSTALWMAAGLLWILDASINVSMEPFRAFVVDMLPEKQHSKGFAMQSFMIGVGAVVASALPWLLGNVFGVVNDPTAQGIPATVKWSFYLGAGAFLGAVLWTVLKTKPYPPSAEELAQMRDRRGFKEVVSEVAHGITRMPPTMRRVALVQFFTWPGLFLMWFYYSSAVAVDVFDATPEVRVTPKGLSSPVDLGFLQPGDLSFCFGLALNVRAVWKALDASDLFDLRCLGADFRGVCTQSQHALCQHDRSGHCMGEHFVHALRHVGAKLAGRQGWTFHGHLQFLHCAARNPSGVGVWLVDGACFGWQQDACCDDWRRAHGACKLADFEGA